MIRTMSGQIYEGMHNVESAARAMLLSADAEEFEDRKAILKDTLRRVQCIREAEMLAHRDYVRAMQAKR